MLKYFNDQVRKNLTQNAGETLTTEDGEQSVCRHEKLGSQRGEHHDGQSGDTKHEVRQR